MVTKFLLFLLLFLFAGNFSFTHAIINQFDTQKNFADEELIIQLKTNTKIDNFLNQNKHFGINLKEKLHSPDTFTIKIPKGQVERLAKIFSINPLIEYAEPNYVATAQEITNDPLLSNQWGLFKTQAATNGSPSAWTITPGSSAVKIAVLDTGIDSNHEDLISKTVARINFTDSSTDDDLYGHGTHVAGIAAAVTNNNIGVAGIGYNSSLMSVKVLNDSGSGYYSWIANGIRWATDNGAKVINMSLGGGANSSTLKNAVNYAWNHGVVVVAASGNSGNSSPTYPAYYANVIAVAATDNNDVKASWSSYGKWVDVAAPGVNIYSTFPNHPYSINKALGYDYGSGTSMATPHVAGLAGLIWETNYGSSNTSVRSRIEATADKITGTGKYWSKGRINAYRAVSP